jgi:hypothetical protein
MSNTNGIYPDIIRQDFIRQDFIVAYAQKWNCGEEYAESLLRHVEITAIEAEIEAAQAIRASIDNDGLYNTSWREGWDDAIERVTPSDA